MLAVAVSASILSMVAVMQGIRVDNMERRDTGIFLSVMNVVLVVYWWRQL